MAPAPCELLTSEEASGLGFAMPGDQRTIIDVPACDWANDDFERLYIYIDAGRDLLADSYRARVFPIFVESSINGMPAVRQRFDQIDNRCVVTVGLGPRQALESGWSGLSTRQTEDPCAKAEEAIALVIRKLPPA